MSQPVRFGRGRAGNVFKPAHQSCPAVSDKPNYYFVNPLQAATGVWQGSETFVEFEVPQTMGILSGATLQFINPSGTAFTGTAPYSGDAGGPYMPPVPYWCSRIEIYVGADLIETAYANDIWNELVNFRSLNDVDNYAQLLNADAKGGFVPTDAKPSSNSGDYFFPVDSTVLRAMKPFVRGFNSKFRYRFYFPPSVAYTVLNSTTAARVTANAVGTAVATMNGGSLRMIFEEQSVDPSVTAELEQAHRTGIVDYTVIVRERQQDVLTNSTPLQASLTIPLYLRSFRNRSAGIAVYFTDANVPNGDLGLKWQFATIQLLDSLGRKLTEILDTEYVASVINAKQITAPILSNTVPDITQPAVMEGFSTQYVSLLPFSSAFEKTLRDGCIYGNYPFTALEQLQLVPATGINAQDSVIVTKATSWNGNVASAPVTATKMVTTTSYSYGHITCSQGNHSFRLESGGR
jgi:hypothetical protein